MVIEGKSTLAHHNPPKKLRGTEQAVMLKLAGREPKVVAPPCQVQCVCRGGGTGGSHAGSTCKRVMQRQVALSTHRVIKLIQCKPSLWAQNAPLSCGYYKFHH